MSNILITSVGSSTAINLIKLLQGHHRIIGTDINHKGYTAGSLMVDTFIQVPLYSSEEYINSLNKIIKDHEVNIMIPIHDFEIQKIASSSLSSVTSILCPSEKIIETFTDKLKATKYIDSIGLPTPKVISESTQSTVIKREKVSVGSRGIEILNFIENHSELLLSDYSNKSYFIQEYISGEEYTVDVACDNNGKPFIIIPRCRLEIKAGVATKVRIVNEPQLIKSIEKIYSSICIPGLSCVQFIKANDKFYFIELNYRFGGMSIASVLASYNYVEDVIANKINPAHSLPKLNEVPIRWNAIVTRYFEEMIFDGQ